MLHPDSSFGLHYILDGGLSKLTLFAALGQAEQAPEKTNSHSLKNQEEKGLIQFSEHLCPLGKAVIKLLQSSRQVLGSAAVVMLLGSSRELGFHHTAWTLSTVVQTEAKGLCTFSPVHCQGDPAGS